MMLDQLTANCLRRFVTRWSSSELLWLPQAQTGAIKNGNGDDAFVSSPLCV